jgi:hypothetical protein
MFMRQYSLVSSFRVSSMKVTVAFSSRLVKFPFVVELVSKICFIAHWNNVAVFVG